MKKLVLALSIILLSSPMLAQSTQPLAQSTQPPAPPLTGTVDDTDTAPPPRYEENVRPLSGVQDFDLGNRTELFNLLTPTFNFSQAYGTNPGLRTVTQGETIWGSTTAVGGSLQLMRAGTNQQLSMSYKGAALINSSDSSLNTQIHSLELSETINTGRWNYVLGNNLSYEPNATGASAPLLFPATDYGSGFRPGISPNDTILTEQNTRLSNTIVGQVSYGLSRASMATANLSYGILHYTNNDFLDTRQLNSTGSYDHKIGRNTIGVGYTYSKFMYAHADENFETNSLEFTCGRRVVGRISVDGAIGPTFIIIHSGAVAFTDIRPTGRANFRYTGNLLNLAVGYSRAVTGGSGITSGALTDSVSGSVQRKLSQSLTANLSAGYSRNRGADGTSVFDNFSVTAGILRNIGRYMSLSLGYNGQQQTSNVSFANLSSNSVVMSLQWRFRPIRLQ